MSSAIVTEDLTITLGGIQSNKMARYKKGNSSKIVSEV